MEIPQHSFIHFHINYRFPSLNSCTKHMTNILQTLLSHMHQVVTKTGVNGSSILLWTGSLQRSLRYLIMTILCVLFDIKATAASSLLD